MATCESYVGRCLTQSLEKYGATELLVLKSILWASVDGTKLSAVSQLANTKAWLCFITKFTEVSFPLHGFMRFKKYTLCAYH